MTDSKKINWFDVMGCDLGAKRGPSLDRLIREGLSGEATFAQRATQSSRGRVFRQTG